MEDRKLQRLKEVLSIPTHSRNEKLMVSYLQNVLTEKGFEHYTDTIGNIYVTKGEAEWYPCFVSHTDTVHPVNLNLKVNKKQAESEMMWFNLQWGLTYSNWEEYNKKDDTTGI